ncbi:MULTISPECIES: cobalt-precorrin-6A reductase [Aphanizomenon]|uniref:Cobalt-precorrin-6A reductase n=1 Tax=Aphanizomenon flos-aquae FACHB-1249 TaxID=2692889 RepID=A0ABR8ISK6_APHFL|nr:MULTISPECIES: cobalt-precorrin-6A reductase [Aphanizomenon]MBD2389977.1 cobalt-precorrin-6A reductase [Aphanizomenon flos-aquae FACHB-1171]MBD2557021.1 cobalt-precorrin-6A reductase [Aphanizomenon flos-aquae FACHB-1290]MBD2631067.1 cobalt-precorrin-6A reductase [Aphanizomenon sp. FACHB-1399]MBD2644296.1 cobalt-precorrin-6A reductase [Aphanizomenon sp. FACHB-1401]MBD2658543.1 cobalt-precorrin-6A reductase [Aphanizomenon flos-aquae FACHB-1265]
MLRVLILGGIGDAVELAIKIANIPGIEVITSLAGRTREPANLPGNVRTGGFGGVRGLTNYLREMQIDLLIDATHPFANQISENAAAATQEVGIPRLMVIRPPWEKLEDDDWLEVEDNLAAATTLANRAKRVFLTIGRQEIGTFAHLQEIWFLMRMIDPPNTDVIIPPGLILCDRGPFNLENEQEILLKYNIDTIVSKNSGGNATYPKIIAARKLGIKVVMVNRPPVPPGKQVADVDSACKWLFDKLDISLQNGK